MGCMACTEPQCLYKGALYLTVELYLYSPYGLYGLYRASVLVQGCTLPLPFLFTHLVISVLCVCVCVFVLVYVQTDVVSS